VRFRVRFSEPIWYLPDHPKARRLVADLFVNAPGPREAEAHALRTTRGPAQIVSVTFSEERPAPSHEALPDVPVTIHA
jgi:hypothetical protein